MKNTFNPESFALRHIGIQGFELSEMLQKIGVSSLEELIDQTVPSSIRSEEELKIPEALTEYEYLRELKQTAQKNKVFRNYIGQGYYGTITPSVLLRNIFQNPGWYTQYTPYQAEIAQGRLEALINFQTMVSDLTGLPITNASLLDEGTAAAEAMAMFYALKNKRDKTRATNEFFVDKGVFAQTLDVLRSRAEPIGIKIVTGDWQTFEVSDKTFGVLLQYPNAKGEIHDYRSFAEKLKEKQIYLSVAADLMSLALLVPPGEFGADVVVGNTQRFGVPMGYGGPHAAYFSTKEDFKRLIPGRIIGVSVDAQGDSAYRMALQTREQHIRREKATSNICTAQALLAIMAGAYAVYHGPQGIRNIAASIHSATGVLGESLKELGYAISDQAYFDTVTIQVGAEEIEAIKTLAKAREINLFYGSDFISISLDETVLAEDLADLVSIFSEHKNIADDINIPAEVNVIPESLLRSSSYMEHPVFHMHRTETQMMRYLKSLENKDLSLMHSMIALGSCTMKLNAASELIPVSWPEFANIHPFAPSDQVQGYMEMLNDLAAYLTEITGFKACSFQPNSGAQGEYAGLMAIASYHRANDNHERNIALIPSSAHGTNPASAVMAGMKVIVVGCDEKGNIDLDDLVKKADEHAENLSSLMVTYPSTHGVFEAEIKEICSIIHERGGLVYMDGANMNAQVGLTSPGLIDADVCHLNLHKTFSIPHGGGGPGMGPICVNEKLASHLPGHVFMNDGKQNSTHAVSSAPFGSASILLISYGYIKMLGREGVTESTKYAILNANYLKARLEHAYPVLYTGEKGRAAHEMIIDLRPFKAVGISAEDIAKRLIDYGFHSPTLSFPVAGTLMIEPTESESKAELDRFCDAMLGIKDEIDAVARGEADAESNVLTNAPHSLRLVTSDDWPYTYSRSAAAFPLPYLKEGNKFWSTVGRVDNAHGDRNLICTCPPLEDYMETSES